MMLAVICHQKRKTFVELPTHGIEIEQALHSIGITQKAKDVLLSNAENQACRVRLFADDEIGQTVLRLVQKTDSIALLNDTLWLLNAHDWSTVRDAMEDGCARTLRQLHDQFEGFFRKYDDVMYRDRQGQYHCILPYDEQTGDGILIDTEGCSHPKYYQLVPNAKLLIDHFQAEQTADQMEDESPEISGISM